MLNDKAQKIFDMKYTAFRGETWNQACWRVAEFVASAEGTQEKRDEYAKKFFELIYNLAFLPGGRILANAGTNIKNNANCFVLKVEDSRDGIYKTLKDAAEIFAWGGGVGYDFSSLREKGADVKTTGGKASGPLSFMSLFDQTGEVISQASRRGAQLGLLNVSHPDIEKFINYKSTPNSRNTRLLEEYKRNLEMNGLDKKGTKYFKVLEKTLQDDQLSHFNISVILDDTFMSSVLTDQEWALKSVTTGEEVKRVKAKDLLMQISNMAWESGDPGIFFYDRTNEDNMVPYISDISAANPCITGDTKILTVYDGPRPIKELAEEGYDVLVYTWNPKTKLPGVSVMDRPRLTRKNTDVIEVEFDSGLKVKCTPDHNFYTFRGNKIQAKDLKVGQSIRAFSGGVHVDKHIRVHGWVDGKAKHQYTARMVWERFHEKIENGLILHHKDLNPVNNRLENLELVTLQEHNQIHGRDRRYKNHKVVSVKELKEKYDVYNGTVDDTHTYIIADDKPVAGDFSGVVSANCGEIPMLPGEPCVLGALNLYAFIKDGKIDFEFLEYAVRTAIRFLDNIQSLNETPVDYVNEMSRGLRRLGLGIMGLADLLAELETPYNSKTAIELSNYLSWFINFFAWLESIDLAVERGAFPYYDKEKVSLKVVEKVLHSKYNKNARFDMNSIRNIGFRNVSVTTIAPTGTIAILAGVNSGIEPFFALSYRRNITEGIGNTAKDFIVELNPILFRKLEKYGFSPDEIEDIRSHVEKTGSLSGLEKIPENIRRIFNISHEISPYEHLDMQASWQEYVSNAISKTTNCPQEITPEEIFDLLVYAWNLGVKGTTIYRDKSKTFQILNLPNGEN